MDPIRINRFYETLVELPQSCGQAECADECKLPTSRNASIGIHEECGGCLHIRPISKSHKAIFCADCGRVRDSEFPRKIETFGGLRQWCANQIVAKKLGLFSPEVLDELQDTERHFATLTRGTKEEEGSSEKELAEIISDAREDCN
jgi:hypothetical protein